MASRVDVARRTLGLIDLTELGDHCTADAVAELCRRAVGPHGTTAAVCIWPEFVAQATQALRSSPVAVATVVNFPHGGEDVDSVVRETEEVVAAGTDEVDLVLPYRSFLAGRVDVATAMIDAVRSSVPRPGRLKV